MAGEYVVVVQGLDAIKSVTDLNKGIGVAAQRAINATLDRTRTSAAREMMRQINFTASYLNAEGRLAVKKRASVTSLEGSIIGRHRPTSLARFAAGGRVNKPGVRLQVKPGFARFLPRAFLIRLRAGTASIDTQSNLGLAIRLRKGETISNKKQVVQLGHGLYLFYGPSVDQVFRTVSEDVAPGAALFLENEFARLLELK